MKVDTPLFLKFFKNSFKELKAEMWKYNLSIFFIPFYTGCPRRNGQNFGRVFLMLNYTDITQNTYIQS